MSGLHAHIAELQRWYKTWRCVPVWSWVRAACAFGAGNYRKAETLYRNGLERHPMHVASDCARIDLAFCLVQGAKLSEASALLKAVVTRAPRLREGYVRLANLQLRCGATLEAAWTLRSAIKNCGADSAVGALLLSAVYANHSTRYLRQEAYDLCQSLLAQDSNDDHELQAALAFAEFVNSERRTGLETLRKLSHRLDAPHLVLLLSGQALLDAGDVDGARDSLKRGLRLTPDNPQVLSLLAKSYLSSGSLYNPEYSIQLAMRACQTSDWSSARELQVLAEAFYHQGDRISALAMAGKAKERGAAGQAGRPDPTLDSLIESISQSLSGTQH